MNKVFFLFISILINPCHAQNRIFEGQILDFHTKTPIPFVNIYEIESTQGVISNEEGKFMFYIPKEATEIAISHIGYQTKNIKITQLKSEFEVVHLETTEFSLEEVIVTNRPVNEILEKLIEISKLQLDKSIRLETYYREFVKVNNQHTKFSDGLIDFYLKPKRKTKIEANLIVHQSRAFQIASLGELNKSTNLDLSETDSFFDIQEATNGFFNFELEKITDRKANKFYDFEIRSKKNSQGKSIETVYIIPKPEVQEVLYEGFVSYDPQKKLILDIELKMSNEHKKFVKHKNAIVFKFAIHDFQLKQTFQIFNDKYQPSYRKLVLDLHIKHGNKFDDRLMSISDLLVTNFHEDVSNIPKEEKFYKGKNLYSSGMNYYEPFWETNNIILLSEQEEKILQSLKP